MHLLVLLARAALGHVVLMLVLAAFLGSGILFGRRRRAGSDHGGLRTGTVPGLRDHASGLPVSLQSRIREWRVHTLV